MEYSIVDVNTLDEASPTYRVMERPHYSFDHWTISREIPAFSDLDLAQLLVDSLNKRERAKYGR